MDKCKLGVISEERLKLEIKLLLNANLIGSHICRVDLIGTTGDLE